MMSNTLERIQELARLGELRISLHGYDELAADGIRAREVVAGLSEAVLVEDYPGYPKGPCVLVLQRDDQGRPIHAVWGIPAGHSSPAVLVTSYRPDTETWDATYTRRLR